MEYRRLVNKYFNRDFTRDGKTFSFSDIFDDVIELTTYKVGNVTCYSINEIAEIVYKNKYSSFRDKIISENKYIKYNGQYLIDKNTLLKWIRKSRKFDIYKIAIPLNTYSSFYREYMTLLPIMKIFQEYDFVRQFHVPKDRYIRKGRMLGSYYSVDLYCKELNLVIECDEYGHKYTCGNDDEREKYIKNKLNCKFIRFNPDAENFNLQNVIDEINNIIHSKTLTFV